MVSVGVTAHVAFVDVVVVVVAVDDGLVGESPHPNANAAPAAPTAPRASRRVSSLEPFIPVASATQSDRSIVTRLWQRRAEIVTRYQPGMRLNPKVQPWPGLWNARAKSNSPTANPSRLTRSATPAEETALRDPPLNDGCSP